MKNLIAASLSVFGMIAMATPAAANCFPKENCDKRPIVVDPYLPKFDSVTIRNREPLDYLTSVNFQREPNISITRVHGLTSDIALQDAPTKIKEGCNPSSSVYCRVGPRSVPVPKAAPAPIRPAPISPAQPQHYGNAGFVPGIAHIPTSIVDRSPENADRALNSGRAVPQRIANGGVAPRPPAYGGSPYGQLLQGPVHPGAILSPPVLAPQVLAPQVQYAPQIAAPVAAPIYCYQAVPVQAAPPQCRPGYGTTLQPQVRPAFPAATGPISTGPAWTF